MGAREVKFPLGQTVITPAALSALDPLEILIALERHQSGDWGEVCASDRSANEQALQAELRLFSVYHSSSGAKVWVITEADRSATTILLPEDY